MNRIVVIAGAVTTALWGPVSPASAYFEQSEVGARALAMGRTFAAVANDASAIYWNPAGLVQLDRAEILLNHHRPFIVPDLSHNFVGLVYPTRLVTLYGAWSHLGLSGVQSEDMLYLGAAGTIWERGGRALSIAATLKLLRVSYSGAVATASDEPSDLGSLSRPAGDVALHLRLSPRLTAGWVARNVGEPEFDFVAGNGSTVIAARQELGLSYRWHPESSVSVAATEGTEGNLAVVAGAEVEFYDVFALRLGVGDLQFYGGVGIVNESLRVDAGFVTHNELGITTMMSVAIPFGAAS